MRWICLRSLAVLAAAPLVLAAGIAVAEQPGLLPASSDEIRVIDPAGARGRRGTSARVRRRRSLRSRQAAFPLRPSTGRRRANVTVVTPRKPADSQSKANPADGSLSPIPDPQEGPPPPLVAASFKGVAPGTSTASGRCRGLGPAEEDHQSQRFPGGTIFRRAVQAGGSELCRRQSVVDRDSARSLVSRQRRGQTTRSDGDSSRVGGQRIGRSPRPGVSRARRALGVAAGRQAGQGLDEGVADYPRTDLGGVVCASRRNDDGQPARPQPPRSGAGVVVGTRQRAGTLALQPRAGRHRAVRKGGKRGGRGRSARSRRRAVPRDARPSLRPGRPTARGPCRGPQSRCASAKTGRT